MTKKQSKPEVQYIALVGLTNDKTGLHFEPGDVVVSSDFPADVLAHWLTKGAIAEVADGTS